MGRSRAVFLDRDGTISVEIGYIDNADDLEIIPGSFEGLKKLQESGFKLIVITNQSGVARGYFEESMVHEINNRLIGVLNASGVKIDAVYFCPHHPDKADIEKYSKKCDCRKPGIKLVTQAVEDLNISLDGSIFIGDKISDIKCGQNAKLRTILVRTGYGEEEEQKILKDCSIKAPDFTADDLSDAANWIIKYDKKNAK